MKTYNIYIILIFILLGCSSNEKRRFERQIGTYVLDTERSTFDSTSLRAEDYKDLTVTFNEDATFIFSRSVPFIWDSSGTWYVEDDLEGSGFGYMKFTKDPEDSPPSSFYSYSPSVSNTILMNSFAPKSPEYFIQEIYFIRLDSLGNRVADPESEK